MRADPLDSFAQKSLFWLVLSIAISSSDDCSAQNYNSPSFGFRTYSGFGTNQASNNFNAGFSGLNPTPQRMPQRSTYQPAASNSAPNTMLSLEQKLNTIDNNTGWSRTPVSIAPPRNSLNASSAMFPRMTKQEALRIFLEGGTPQTQGGGAGSYGSSSLSGANASTAYSNYQTAVNEEAKARNWANTARYDSNKWNRKNAATQAEYAANNANYAAQRAESAAYSGDGQARSYANLARQAANRARDNANRARYNADTIP